MTITSVAEVAGSRAGSVDGESGEERIEWLCLGGSARESMYTILQAGVPLGLPNYMAIHPTHPFAKLVKLSYRTAAPTTAAIGAFIVTGEYSTKITQKERDKEEEDPTARPAIIKWSQKTVQTAVHNDIFGNAIINTSGEYFDPPIERTARHWTATVTKNVAVVPAWILTYQDEPINDDDWEIDGITVLQGCAKLMDLSISEWQEENLYAFRQLQMTFEFKAAPTQTGVRDGNTPADLYTPAPYGWTGVYLDQGCAVLNSSGSGSGSGCNSGQVNMTDDDGAQVTSPRLLDGAGQRLLCPTPQTAIWLAWEILTPLDFSVLPVT